ncbi:MAG TPA: homocysteine S-methyltransferase family protein [Spirochaetia bacterium]|nr:homocysteine S-methyltransferase family protein [Spirochaetia bacterium]
MTGLAEWLKGRQPLLLDGAMGTELDRRGVEGRCLCNLSGPRHVIAVHRDYREAGSHAVITNTLTMNRSFIESHRIGVDVLEVNRAGAALAREAAGPGGLVLGNLSSTGQLLEPYGPVPAAVVLEAFREQARVLAEGGVDGFIIETMIDLREAECALKACKEVSGLPVIVCIAFDTAQRGGRTVMGNSAEQCVRSLTEAGADAVGANCGGVDPAQMAEIVSRMVSISTVPVAAEPNAGLPKLVGGKTVFDMEPRSFALGLAACAKAGATILGGCCGTTPDHIRAFAALGAEPWLV